MFVEEHLKSHSTRYYHYAMEEIGQSAKTDPPQSPNHHDNSFVILSIAFPNPSHFPILKVKSAVEMCRFPNHNSNLCSQIALLSGKLASELESTKP
jgi:hypothetical protein